MGQQEQYTLRNGGKGQKCGQCWGHSAGLDGGYRRLKIVVPPRQRVMDPPLQLEADEKVEEKEEQSREQCRGVLGKGEEALTCPLCAQ